MKTTLSVLVVAALIKCSCLAQESTIKPPYERIDYIVDENLYQVLASNVVMSLNSASNSALIPSVDAALDKMMAERKDRIATSFIVAKMEWLLNRPTKAISILENVIQKYGEKDSGQDIVEPVAITGNYWIGTIARQTGDAKRAKRAYEDILAYIAVKPQYAGVAFCCHLYISEIEAVMLKQKGAALETLIKINKMPKPVDENVKDWGILQAWNRYQIAILEGKQEESQKILEGSGLKTFIALVITDNAVKESGIAGRCVRNFNIYGGKNRILLIHGLQSAIESNSPLDRSFALLRLGQVFESDRPAESEKYYTELLESDSFFAPEGGIFLADFQKKQGKADEAKKTYEKIKQRFPGYTKYVDELAKDPKPMKFGM